MNRNTAAGSGGRPNLVRLELAPLLKLAGPVALSRVGIMVMGLTDAVVVGRYSATQLGYHALAWAPAGVIVTMAVGLLAGVQVMTARAIGEGRRDLVGAVLRRGLVYALWIGLASGAVLAAFGPALLRLAGLEADLARGASLPLVILALSLPAFTIGVAASSWLEGLSRPGPTVVAMWAANGVNLALLLLLVPGSFGLPALGAAGAAWATGGARTFLAAALLAYIATMREARALGVFAKPQVDRPAAAEQVRVGLGAGASNFLEAAAFASMSIIAGWLGGLEVAAWAIVLNVSAVIFMVPLGLSTAGAVRVGLARGACDEAGVNRAGAVAFVVAALFGVAAALAVGPAAGLVARGYTGDMETLRLAVPALALACLFFIPDAVQVVAAQALRARGDVWPPTLTHLASYILVMAPLAWWLAIPMGLRLTGVVWAVITASFVSAGLLLARFWMLSRRGV